jgi:hypothetical protein
MVLSIDGFNKQVQRLLNPAEENGKEKLVFGNVGDGTGVRADFGGVQRRVICISRQMAFGRGAY